MMNRPLPPPHPSLPRPPIAAPQIQSLHPSTSYAAYPAHYTYSSHYAQAYYPQMAPQSAPAAGFNFSSVATNPIHQDNGTHLHAMSTWYKAGNIRCSYPGCAFRGSQQSVEIHRMDRHLIYPPDWDKRKKKSEWDADPSLKGKAVPIQGTSVILDTPEVIDAWIAERKKRFPTSSRVEEKKRKLAEAMERGQLDLNPSRFARPHKRQKTDCPDGQGSRRRGNIMPDRNLKNRRRQRNAQESAPEPNVAPTAPPSVEKADKESDDEDDNVVPEELSSRLPDMAEGVHGDETISTSLPPRPQPQAQRRLKEPQPRGPPKNPFASRPALLRNLFLPEIRMTVSNLSQAIRFLVDNDFLRNVELKPGQAAEQQKIHVLNSQESSVTF